MIEAATATAGAMIATAAAGAWLYRARGRRGPLPHAVEHGAWALALTAPAFLLMPLEVAAVAAGLAYLGTTPGHGSGIDMGRNAADDPRELWRHLWAPEDSPRHDTRFMVVSGLFVTLALGVTAAFYVGPAWGAIGLVGALKGPAYYAGHRLALAGRLRQPTVFGEYATGAATGAGCAVLWFPVFEVVV